MRRDTDGCVTGCATGSATIAANDHSKEPVGSHCDTPENTKMQATTLFFPHKVFQLSSLRKSSDIRSTNDAKVSKPAEIAFITPTTSSPTSDPGLWSVCVARPIACPMGVL